MRRRNPLLVRLLRTNLSAGQLAGYVAANVVGLAVILTGLLFYGDCTASAGAGDDPFLANDYVVVSKTIDGIAFSPVAFSEQEIADIAAQPWARKVGRFTSSQFAMRAAVSLGGRGMSTYMFCESVPDEFFDVKPEGWTFDPDDPFVPMVLSKDYLALYNFGFAMPQGLPKVSEEVIASIPIELTLSGASGLPENFEAGIAGFSSRLNTIAVPQSFMDWANRRYSPESAELPPSRLIIRTDPLMASQMERYFADRGIEIAGDREGTSQLADVMGLVALVVTCNGVVICALALFILVLSIYLLLQKNEAMLRNVIRLGYAPRRVSRVYERLVAGINAGVGVVALAVALSARRLWLPALSSAGLGGGSPWVAVAVAAGFFLLTTGWNIAIIRRRVGRFIH